MVVLAAAALAIILGVVGGTFVAGGRTPVPPGSTPTPTTGAASDPAAVVRGFLEAVARNDATAALAYAETQPADTSYMSAEVLTAANAANPVTEINVPPVPSSTQDSMTVQASYKIGAERVTQGYDLDLVNGVWMLSEVGAELDLSSQRSEVVPLILAGRTVDADTISLLPGAYEVTSGLTYLDWGPENTILVKGPGAFLSASKLDLSINDAGTAALLVATKASLNACVKIKKVDPSGCPFSYSNSSYKVTPSTISWTLTEDPLADVTPRLSNDDDGRGTVTASIRLQFTAKGKTTYDGKAATISSPVSASATASADLTGDSVTVTWK